MTQRALVVALTLLLCLSPCEGAGMSFRLFDWLTGNDAALHEKLIAFFKLDPAKLPALDAQPDGGMRLVNHGGAPAAIAWSPLDLDTPGLYTLRFQARWEGEGDQGRAAAGFGTSRLDFSPTRAWTAYSTSMRMAGDSGPSSLSFSLRARQGVLEIRSVELVRVPFDARASLDGAQLRLEVVGRAPADATLRWRAHVPTPGDPPAVPPKPHFGGDIRLGDLAWDEREGVARATLPGPAGALPPGTVFDWTITVGDPPRVAVNGNRVRLAAPPAVRRGGAPRSVTVRDDGTMLLEGRPFFPVGMYLHDTSEAMLEEVAAQRLNLVIFSPGPDPAKLARLALERGMQPILETTIPAEREKIEATARDIVERYGRLPVFAWTAVDEPDLKPGYPALLPEIRATLARLDGRPLYQSNHSPRSFWTVGVECDILALDPYPVAAVPRPIATVGAWIDEARAATGRGRSVWLIQQAFAEAPFWPQAPSPAQLHAMTWIALNHGARGIVYYAINEILDPASKAHGFEWNLRRTPLWEQIKREAAEMRAAAPFLTREGGRQPLAVAGPFDAALWRDGDRFLISLVNLSDDETEAVLGVPPDGDGDLRIFPDGMRVKAGVGPPGRVAVRLPAYGVLLLSGTSSRTHR